jgi:hypothetical protein
MYTSIGLSLSETLYSRSGFSSTKLTPQQLAFGSVLLEFVNHVDGLRKQIKEKNVDTVSIAVAVRNSYLTVYVLIGCDNFFFDFCENLLYLAHSLRAVDVPAFNFLLNWANWNDLAFHLHLEEQPKEIEDCMAVEGRNHSDHNCC